jgi:hypothetical protein
MCLQKHILIRFCDLNIVKMSVFLNVPAKIQKVPASGARTLAHFINAWLLMGVKGRSPRKFLDFWSYLVQTPCF